MKRILTSASFWVIVFSIVIMTMTQLERKRWRNGGVIRNDIIEYYAYLPAFFIENDLKLGFVNDPERMEGKIYWFATHPNGSRVFKYTMGMSFLYAPFFFMAHLYAGIMDIPQTGFSAPYQVLISLSSLFYLFWGLLFLRKVLLRYFSEIITAATLLLIVIGTNLYHYATVEAAMTHAYNFSLVALLMWLTIKWHERPSWIYTGLLGFVCGLLFIIRPVNGLLVLIPMLYDVKNLKSLKEKALFFLNLYPRVLLMGMIAFLVVLPQMIYWKYVNGSFIVYSYTNEGFFFSDPMIFRGLFSFRKGWYLYTPIMLLATFGLWWARKYATAFPVAIGVFMVINIYVLMSWWAWWYGGGFGQRTLIDSYPLMAIGLASFLKFMFHKRRKILTRISVTCLLGFLLWLNIVQTQQYKSVCIHWDSMSREYYFAIFGKTKCPPDIQHLLSVPDYEAAIKGDRRQ